MCDKKECLSAHPSGETDKEGCRGIYNCCDCGGDDCGCYGCYSCNVCENCLDNDNNDD